MTISDWIDVLKVITTNIYLNCRKINEKYGAKRIFNM